MHRKRLTMKTTSRRTKRQPRRGSVAKAEEQRKRRPSLWLPRLRGRQKHQPNQKGRQKQKRKGRQKQNQKGRQKQQRKGLQKQQLKGKTTAKALKKKTAMMRKKKNVQRQGKARASRKLQRKARASRKLQRKAKASRKLQRKGTARASRKLQRKAMARPERFRQKDPPLSLLLHRQNRRCAVEKPQLNRCLNRFVAQVAQPLVNNVEGSPACESQTA